MMYVSKHKSHKIALFISMKKSSIAPISQFGDRVGFLVLLRSSWCGYWRKYCFLDGARSILSLWDKILPAEEVKRAQWSTTVAAVVVQHVQHLTWRSPNITVKGRKYVEPNRVAYAWTSLRYGERTGAEQLGLMCYRYFALGGDAHVVRRSLAFTRQVILRSSYVRRSTTLFCENKQSSSFPYKKSREEVFPHDDLMSKLMSFADFEAFLVRIFTRNFWSSWVTHELVMSTNE